MSVADARIPVAVPECRSVAVSECRSVAVSECKSVTVSEASVAMKIAESVLSLPDSGVAMSMELAHDQSNNQINRADCSAYYVDLASKVQHSTTPAPGWACQLQPFPGHRHSIKPRNTP